MKLARVTNLIQFLFSIVLPLHMSSCALKSGNFTSNPKPLISNYTFQYDNAFSPKLTALRASEKLDALVSKAKSDQEVFELLTIWTRRQFEPGFPNPYPPSNGWDILRLIRSGVTKGFCGQYSYLLADALKSIGYLDVRYVELIFDDARSHFLVEAWNNQMARWVLLDPLYATVIENSKGELLSAWDVHHAAKNSAEELHRRWLVSEQDVPRNSDSDYFLLYSRVVAISVTNNLSEMVLPWSITQRKRDFLAIRTTDPSAYNQYYQNVSEQIIDFKPTRNICFMEANRAGNKYDFVLANLSSCAYFDYFEVKRDQSPWQKSPSKFSLEATSMKIQCRTVNKFGIKGQISELVIS